MDKTKIAVAVFDRRASEYQAKYMDLDLYDDTFDFFCGNIKKQHAEILELACGPGNITKYLLKKRPDFRILATDLAPNMLDLASKNNPGAEFRLMDCRDISDLSKKYDGIIGGFCLPYLSKEEAIKLIHDAAALLNSNGLLYLSTMEGEYSKSGLKSSDAGDELYMHFHEAGYLTDAFEESELEIIELKRKDFPTADGTKVVDLVIVGRRQH